MADDALTAADYVKWLTPLEALAAAHQAVGESNASSAIWERLRGGMIRSVAKYATTTLTAQSPQGVQAWFPIPGGYWQHYQQAASANFWETGDARFHIPSPSDRILSRTVRCVGIRLNPVDIFETLPPPRQWPTQAEPGSPQIVSPPASRAESEAPRPPPGNGPTVSERPRVPDPVLRDWYELYRRAYPGAEDTEATALKSAFGMFPGKSVSRGRVRELRGPQKIGRKPRETKE
jgi:hypothetical protein